VLSAKATCFLLTCAMKHQCSAGSLDMETTLHCIVQHLR
jgi:hypothetical protein